MEAEKGTSTESVKDLKKKLKSQKKSAKKEKKKRKIERKLAKKEVKMRKKGVFLEDIVPEEEKAESEGEAEVVPEVAPAPQWIKKSAEPIPTIERKIDKIAERTQKSRLHDLFEQKYGESLIVPEIVEEYKLTEDERERLSAITGKKEETIEVKAEAPVAVAPIKAPAEIKEEGVAQVAKAEGVAVQPVEEKVEKIPEVEEKQAAKSFFYPFQLWLYSKYGKEKMIILKIIILLISIVGFLLLLIPRILIYFLILFPIRKIKERKVKAPSKNKKKQKGKADQPEKAVAES